MELGQTFARFGTRVTILQRSPRIIPEHEPEISEALTDYLREEGLGIAEAYLVVLFTSPILVVTYIRLARREEVELEAKFGERYATYRGKGPMFFPRPLRGER